MRLKVYPDSKHKRGGSNYCMAATDTSDILLLTGPDIELFEGEVFYGAGGELDIRNDDADKFPEREMYKLCPLTNGNSAIIRELFDFTRPVSHKGQAATIGLGDRLGTASAGHIRLIRDLDIFPVLAQQSMRELNLTGRTYEDVLAAAVWAVFREGYTNGYGADGDHLKSHDEVRNALNCGFTMITLDCSGQIRNDLSGMPQPDIEALYEELPADVTTALEDRYLDKTFSIGRGMTIEFNKDDFMRNVLIYLPAINHALSVYDELLKSRDIDFEISIDETLTATTAQAHFFFSNELIRQGVQIRSVAPRFTGEFQKGIDYIGNVTEFERDFLLHAKIADNFGYKISVHSGSDKFSIFPIVSRLTGGRYHIKTAGTNWLEAVRVIANTSPRLFREMFTFALENLSEAREYYHITCDLTKIANLADMPDSGLHCYLDEDNARQVLHITYGLILQAKEANGSLRFRERIYQLLFKHELDYMTALEKRIGLHMSGLCVKKRIGN